MKKEKTALSIDLVKDEALFVLESIRDRIERVGVCAGFVDAPLAGNQDYTEKLDTVYKNGLSDAIYIVSKFSDRKKEVHDKTDALCVIAIVTGMAGAVLGLLALLMPLILR